MQEVLTEVKDVTATCTICYNDVEPTDFLSTLWAPCCRKNGWFHTDCVQRYFFKCPLCNDKKKFWGAMSKSGVYIPKQDASWEREPNGFAELLQRHNSCDAKVCDCRQGRFHTIAGTRWEILCRHCASKGIHVKCGNLNRSNTGWECCECTLMLHRRGGSGTRAVMKSLNHHLILSLLNPAVCLVHFLILKLLHPAVCFVHFLILNLLHSRSRTAIVVRLV